MWTFLWKEKSSKRNQEEFRNRSEFCFEICFLVPRSDFFDVGGDERGIGGDTFVALSGVLFPTVETGIVIDNFGRSDGINCAIIVGVIGASAGTVGTIRDDFFGN